MKSILAVVAIVAIAASLAPTALAQDAKNETAPEDGGQAWVDDCPPDMMCAFGGGADGSDGNATRGPEGCENCRDLDGESKSGEGVPDGAVAKDPDAPTSSDEEPYFPPCESEICTTSGPSDGREPAPNGEEAAPVSASDNAGEASKAVPAFGVAAALGALGALALARAARKFP